MVPGVPTAQAFGQVTRQDSARDVLRNRAARVEDLRVAEAVLRPQKSREELLELGAQKAGRAEPVGLKDDDDARRAGLRRGDGRADLLAIVRVVVHDADAARGRAHRLEPARDAGEACEQGLDLERIDAELERDQRGGGGILEVVEPGLRDVDHDVAALDPQHARGAAGADAGDPQARVDAGRDTVRGCLESAPERGRLRTRPVDEKTAAVLGEGRELRAKRVQLRVVAAHVVDETERGPIADERAVGLAGLGHDGALGGAGDEAAARALVHERGAAQHGGGHARLAHEPGHHTDDGALAARARDGDARAAGVDDLGQELRAGDAVEAERARRSHLGCVGLDRRRIDEAVDRSRDGGPVVWRELDSQQSEPRGDVLVLPLVERAVGALDVVTARPHQGGERVHPGAGDAGEVISHRDPPLSRLAELRRSACLLGFFFSEARF